MKLIVCESCDAEFSIKHSMSTRQYQIALCPFCGDSLDNEMEDDVDFYDDEYED